MHWTGIDRAVGRGPTLQSPVPVEILRGIGGEFGAATGRAEMEGLAAVAETVLHDRGIDRHAANGIAGNGFVTSVMMLVPTRNLRLRVCVLCVIHPMLLKYIPHGGI